MPRTVDPYLHGQLPRSHDPLKRLSTPQVPKRTFDAVGFRQQWSDFFDNWGLDIIQERLQASRIRRQMFVQTVIAPFVGLIHPLLGREGNEELLADGSFNEPTSLAPEESGWEYIDDEGRTDDGCLRANLDGSPKARRSNPITVQEGQKLTIHGYCEWSGLDSSSVIHLDVVEFVGSAEGTTVTIASVTSPATNQTAWGRHLTNVYTVPPGIDGIQVRLYANGPTGYVQFDDYSCKMATKLQQLADTTRDNLQEQRTRHYNKILGIDEADVTIDNFVDGSIEAQLEAEAGRAATLAQLVAASTPGANSNNDSENFEDPAGPLSTTEWDIYTNGAPNGSIETDGHNLNITANLLAVTPYEVIARRKLIKAKTDEQSIEVVFESAPGRILFANGHNHLWLRMSTFTTYATRTGLRFDYFASGRWELNWFSAGTATLLDDGDMTNLLDPGYIGTQVAKSSTLRFAAGVGGIKRRYCGWLNGKPFLDTTDVAAVSQYGASYLGRGVGGRIEAAVFNYFPGKIRQFTATG